MHRIVVFLTIFIVSSESTRSVDNGNEGQIVANMNEYMDLVMKDAAPWIVTNGLDPLRLQDITNQFEYKPVFVLYHGRLHLTNGVLHNLRNITRSGNAILYYGDTMMRVECDVSMANLNFRYDYDATIMNMGRHGWIDGSVTNVNLYANFIVDMDDFYVYLHDFRIMSIGHLDVRVRGNTLTDWLGNIIITMVTAIFKTTMVNYISTRVLELAQITCDGINSRMSIYDRREVAAKFFNDIEIKTMRLV